MESPSVIALQPSQVVLPTSFTSRCGRRFLNECPVGVQVILVELILSVWQMCLKFVPFRGGYCIELKATFNAVERGEQATVVVQGLRSFIERHLFSVVSCLRGLIVERFVMWRIREHGKCRRRV